MLARRFLPPHRLCMNPTSQNIGIIGLGIIGSRVAENVKKAGHNVFTWSHSPRSQANFMTSPRAVAEAAQIIQIFVRDDEALLSALRSLQPALTRDHLVMNHATVSKAATLAAAELCAQSGAAFLDAPFTGSKMAAQNATQEDKARLLARWEAHCEALNEMDQFLYRDMLFHREIASISGNPIFPSIVEALFNWAGEYYQNIVRAPGSEQLTLAEHRRIYEAIADSNGDLAAEAMRDHLLRANELYRRSPTDTSSVEAREVKAA